MQCSSNPPCTTRRHFTLHSSPSPSAKRGIEWHQREATPEFSRRHSVQFFASFSFSKLFIIDCSAKSKHLAVRTNASLSTRVSKMLPNQPPEFWTTNSRVD